MDRLRLEIMRDEGRSLQMYLDTESKWTVGYGRNLSQRGISEDEAEYLLDNDITIAIKDAQQEWAEFWDDLSRIRREVLVNMTFNMGRGRFRRDKWPGLEGALLSRDYEKAGDEMMDSLWARQVGDRAHRLAVNMRGG